MIKKFSLEDEKLLRHKGYIQFAQVGRPHGLKGAFFLKTPDNRTEWDGYSQLLLQTNNGFYETKVIKSYTSGKALAIILAGIEQREAVEALYNKNIFVHETEIPIGEDEYLVANLIGFKVYAETKGYIGTIQGVSSFGAQDNLEIYIEKYKKVFLYPFIDSFVTQVSQQDRRVDIKYVPEFLEDESE